MVINTFCLNIAGAAGVTINLNGTSNIVDIGKTYQLITLANAIVAPVGGVAPALTNNDTAIPKPAWAYNNASRAISNHAGEDPHTKSLS